MRALTGLKQAGIAVQKNDAAGRLPEIALNKIHVDPNNARRLEDETSPEGLEAQTELTQDIRRRGVKSPVSLRPHPAIPGQYMLNYGHRRLRAAIEAGLTMIPYFIDVNFDSYDQVKENLLHRKPSIWALAEFIQRKLDEGQSKGEIAEGLGKANQNLVTELLALVDAPACLHEAYAKGVKSMRTLYDLRRAYDEYPEQTETWCASTDRITRESIRALVLQCQDLADRLHAHGASDVGMQPEQTSGHPTPAKPVSAELAEPPPGVLNLASPPRVSRDDAALAGDDVQWPVPAADELRHDVKTRDRFVQKAAPLATEKLPPDSCWISVEYQGKAARMASDATVQVLLDGDNSVLDVFVADLTFSKRQ